MTVIVVDWTDWLKDIQIHRAPDAATASAYAETLPNDRTAFVLDTSALRAFESEMRCYGNLKVAELYSALTGTRVARFNTLDHGISRLVDHLSARGRDAPPVPVQPKEQDDMPRRAKIGAFKPVRRDTNLGKVYAAIIDGHEDIEDIARETCLAADKVRAILATGRKNNGVDFSVGAETRTVAIVVPAGVDLFKAPKSTEKPARKPREVFVGKASPVRAGSTKHKVLEAALADGATLAGIAAAAELPEEKAKAVLAALRKEHGVTHEVAEDGRVSVRLPDGHDAATMVKRPAERPARDLSTPRDAPTKYGRAKDLDDAAARGDDPPKPIIASQANAKVVQKHFDRAEELATAGDWDGLAKLHIGGSNSYMKMARAYRDRLLVAHRAREAGRAAAE